MIYDCRLLICDLLIFHNSFNRQSQINNHKSGGNQQSTIINHKSINSGAPDEQPSPQRRYGNWGVCAGWKGNTMGYRGVQRYRIRPLTKGEAM
jgi:hypothetical protein